MNRRAVVAALGAAALAACAYAPVAPAAVDHLDLADLEARLGPGGRLGVAAIDLGTGRQLQYSASDRFALCSTFKMTLAAAVLARADRGELALSDRIPFGEADLLQYAPVVRANRQQGWLSVEELAAAAVEVSDNSAANLLLPLVGGPAGLTAFMRRAGDPATRLDRTEPALNENAPGDPRDTTTPAAMAKQMREIFAGSILSEESKQRLARWMVNASTGLNRLRAGFPKGWIAGDKTGTCMRGAANDVAIAWPPGRAPIVVASYISEGTADPDTRNAVHAEVASRVAAALR